jgi:hypothetical protein
VPERVGACGRSRKGEHACFIARRDRLKFPKVYFRRKVEGGPFIATQEKEVPL